MKQSYQLVMEFKKPLPDRAYRIHARRSSAPQLRKVLNILSDHLPHTTRQIIDKANLYVCAVNSIIAELRANGYEIKCRQTADRRFEYRLI